MLQEISVFRWALYALFHPGPPKFHHLKAPRVAPKIKQMLRHKQKVEKLWRWTLHMHISSLCAPWNTKQDTNSSCSLSKHFAKHVHFAGWQCPRTKPTKLTHTIFILLTVKGIATKYMTKKKTFILQHSVNHWFIQAISIIIWPELTSIECVLVFLLFDGPSRDVSPPSPSSTKERGGAMLTRDVS